MAMQAGLESVIAQGLTLARAMERALHEDPALWAFVIDGRYHPAIVELGDDEIVFNAHLSGDRDRTSDVILLCDGQEALAGTIFIPAGNVHLKWGLRLFVSRTEREPVH